YCQAPRYQHAGHHCSRDAGDCKHRGTWRRRWTGRRNRGVAHGSRHLSRLLCSHRASQHVLLRCRVASVSPHCLLTRCCVHRPHRVGKAGHCRRGHLSMIKRAFDIVAAFFGLLVFSPLLAAVMLGIWLQDRQSPFYIAPRAARGGGEFRMVKFRSMVTNADKIGGSSTAASDRRITPIGHFVRAYKLDELIQLWNVLKGDMSLVGPRPQVLSDAALYTRAEKRMLSVRPGITDLASIVFSDEGEILKGSADPDLLYNQIIRPWKSRLALAYIDHQSLSIDLWLILLTLLVVVSRTTALRRLGMLLRAWKLDALVIRMATRQEPLLAYPPPGAEVVVQHL